MEPTEIKVLLIEDDPMVQEVNRQFVERVEGFKVIGAAANGEEGIRLVHALRPDLVLLDVFMPTQDGIETIRQLRAEETAVDVIVITAARDPETIARMKRNGAFDYILKPFKFERVEQSLQAYRRFRSGLTETGELSQAELDRMMGNTAPSLPGDIGDIDLGDLPKGLNPVTLKQVLQFVSRRPDSLSAEEVADGVGMARVTARRYLEHLEKNGRLKLDVRYGEVGRPVNRYLFLPGGQAGK